MLGGLAAIVLGLGGLFILLALALGVAWAGHFTTLSLSTWVILLVATVLAELAELGLGVIMARTFGATRWGMIGAFAGGVAGTIVGTAAMPVVGTLVGAFLGSFAGAVGGELLRGESPGRGLRAGCGAFMGRVLAATFKLGLGIVIAFLTLRAAYLLAAGGRS